MKRWVLEVLEKERKSRGVPLEVKKLNNNYYLYHSTTRWDKQEKKIKKVTGYLGRMTPKGVIERKEFHGVRSICEYGNAEFLYRMAEDILEPLERSFFYRWKELLACSIVKTLQPLSLRLIKSRWDKLHLSQTFEASLSPNTLSDVLREVGRDYASQKKFFDVLMADGGTLAFDLSSLFSCSENLQYAEKGHNADHLYLKQINFMLFFSVDRRLPVLLKPLPGSVKDIKALKTVIDEVKAKDGVLVLDRGFASYKLPDLLEEHGLKIVLPLRRNFKEIDYGLKLEHSFIYRKRGIRWGVRKFGGKSIYLYEDVKLRAEEETTYIQLMEEGEKTKKDCDKESKKFGRIAVLTNLKKDGKEIYLMHKDRESVEVAFDALKNELENDKTYLSDDDALRGYFFVSFLSLYLYYKTLNLLRKSELADKISVNELLLELSKVYEIRLGETKKLSEIPEKARKLTEALGVDIFPKKLRS